MRVKGDESMKARETENDTGREQKIEEMRENG